MLSQSHHNTNNQNNSPNIRTSLSSRIASMEGTNNNNYNNEGINSNEGSGNFGGGMMAPELIQQQQQQLLGSGGNFNSGSINSLGNNQQQQRTSSVSFHSNNNNNNLTSPTYQQLGGGNSLGGSSLGSGLNGGSQLGVNQLGGTTIFSPSQQQQSVTRDSLSYTPFEMENGSNNNNNVLGGNNLMLGGGSAGSGTLNTNSLLLGQQQKFGTVQQQQHFGAGGQQHGVVRDELSGGMGHQQQQQQLGSNDIRSPSSAFTTVNNSLNKFGNSGEESSPPFNMANVANGLERTSSNMGIGLSGIGGVAAAGMGNSATVRGSAEGGGRVMRKYQPRETSLLVSPIPQSDAFNNGGGRGGNSSVDAPGSAGSRSQQYVAATTQQQQQYGPTGTPSTSLQQQQPQGADATPQQYSGRDPTPYHYRSNPSTSPSANNNNKKKTSSSSGSKESVASTTSSSRSGLDPPAKSPFPTSIHAHHTTTSSSQNNSSSSLRTPNGMMMGRESSQQQQQQGYTTGYATNKSTPNVNSHHYQHLMAVEQQHQQLRENNSQQQVELSMIQEDTVADHHHHGGGIAVGNDEMSHVTGSSTFVRTPNVLRKGQQYTPKNTSYYTTTPGSTTSATVIATAATGNNNNNNNTSDDDSPSMVMRRELDNLASQTSNTLDEIWDCVGVPHEERINQFHDLVEQFQVVFDAVINKEEGMRIQFTKEIDEARTEWKSICLALKLNEEDPVRKMKRDPSSKDVTSHTTLQVEYETLDLRLQELRKIKEVAMSDMEGSRGRICEAFAALNGCTVDEAHTSSELHSFMDIVSDLTDARREEFRSKALEYEESVNSRTKAIVSLIMDCQSMIRELEIEPPSMEAAVGCDEDDAKIMNSLSRADAGDEDESSKDDQQQPPQLRRGNSNDYTIVDLFESSTCMGISTSSLDRLTTRIAELNGEKRRRRAKLAEMGATISSLWQMLRVPSEEQRAFTTSIRGLGLDTIRKGEAEIVRLEELKAVMIGKLVREQRDMIEELWDKTNSSVAERSSFNTYFHITDEERLTSDILIKHEEYVSSLKAKLDKMQPILDLIAKRETIIDERSELEILQKDPDRLQGRGAAKQLAKEEKMSRRVTKELPKITGILEKTLRQWYVENKPNKEKEEVQVVDPDLGHFMYQGIPYLQTMKHQDEEWRTRKERAEEERQRKREEERAASSAANRAFGYTNTYTKLPGKKTSYNSRPRSASNVRSGSSTSARSGSNLRSGGARPTSSSSTRSERFGGRGPLGDVSSSKQNTSRPPSRPRGGGDHQGGKKVVAGGRGYRPASAPRMRL